MAKDITVSLHRVDEAIDAVAQTIARLSAELSAARDEAEKLAVFREMALKFAEPTHLIVSGPDAGVDAKRVPRAGSKAAQICEAALRKLQRPGQIYFQTADLIGDLKIAGVEIGGDNEPAYIASVLSRDPRFVSERPHGWRLAQPVPVSEGVLITETQAEPAPAVQPDEESLI